MKKDVLLTGIQKVGSARARFTIFNYYAIKNHGYERTLTWDELEKPHVLRKEKGIEYEYDDGYPYVFFTHLAYDGQGINKKHEGFPEFYEQFDTIIYLYRNPYDTNLSYYHFMGHREKRYPMKLRDFIKWFTPKWIHHVKTTMHKADLVLNYDVLWENPIGYLDAMNLIDDDVDLSILERSLRLSSFDNIRKMGVDTGKPYGLGGPQYFGEFCRDGRVGQYKKKMIKDFQEWIQRECEKEGIVV